MVAGWQFLTRFLCDIVVQVPQLYYVVYLYSVSKCYTKCLASSSRRLRRSGPRSVHAELAGTKMLFQPGRRVGTWTRSCVASRLGPLTGHFRPVSTVTAHRSVLPIVHSAINLALPSGPFNDPAVIHQASCNAGSVPPEDEERLVPMFLRATSLSSPIGFLRPNVVQKIVNDHQESGERSIWNVLSRTDDSPWAVCFADNVTGVEARTHAMRAVLQRWKTEGLFPDVLRGMGLCSCPSQMNSPQLRQVGVMRRIPCTRLD